MTNNITLRSIDLTPFRRFGVGFDRMFEEFEKNFDRASSQGYPPFNLERTSENEYRITMAVLLVLQKLKSTLQLKINIL